MANLLGAKTMARAKTYLIEYMAEIGGKRIEKTATFITKAETISDVINRWRRQLCFGLQIEVISCKSKHR